jgi:hypothetical protein
MKTAEGRKLIFNKYTPDSPEYQGAQQYELMQRAQASRRPIDMEMARQGQEHMSRVTAIARGLMPGASEADKAAMQAAITAGERPVIIQGQLKAQNIGINVLKDTAKSTSVTPEQTNHIIGGAMNMNDAIDATGTHLKYLTDPTHPIHSSPAIDGYKKKLNERASMWLINDNKELGYATKIANSMSSVGSSKDISVTPEGKLSLNPVYAANAPSTSVLRTQEYINRANNLLDIVHYTGGDRKAMATSIKAEMDGVKVNRMGAAQSEANRELIGLVAGSTAAVTVQKAASFVRDTFKDLTGASREEFLDRVKSIESGGTPNEGRDAVSKAGAKGPYQIMDNAMKDINKDRRIPFTDEDRKDPIKSRQMASIYFDKIKNYFNTSDPVVLLAAYNYGMGNVRELMKKYPDDWILKLPKETQRYIYKMSGGSSIGPLTDASDKARPKTGTDTMTGGVRGYA